jgi:hypothetical protein
VIVLADGKKQAEVQDTVRQKLMTVQPEMWGLVILQFSDAELLHYVTQVRRYMEVVQ